jgi:hypothetical protein
MEGAGTPPVSGHSSSTAAPENTAPTQVNSSQSKLPADGQLHAVIWCYWHTCHPAYNASFLHKDSICDVR